LPLFAAFDEETLLTLTGSALLVTAAILTVAVFAAAIVGLPMIRANRWIAGGLRAVVLVVVNAFVLLTVAIAFNDKYQFYADWTDLGSSLFGGPVQAVTTHAGASTAETFGSTADGVRRVVTYQVTGRLSGLTGEVLVTLPNGYHRPDEAHHRYPVIETFPGYPASPAQWFTDMNLAGVLGHAEQTRAIAQAITISPQTEFPGGIDDECVNGPGRDPKVETWLARDVPSWVEHTFRVLPSRTSWATLGMSAGGWCAAMLTMLHPLQYAAGIIMGGYYKPEFTHLYRPFDSQSRQWRRYNLIRLAHHHSPPVALWIQTSRADRSSYPSSARLLAAARAPLSIDAVILLHAGHRFSAWTPLLPKALAWLGSHIPGFHASGTSSSAKRPARP
jgi:hypothetical protein